MGGLYNIGGRKAEYKGRIFRVLFCGTPRGGEHKGKRGAVLAFWNKPGGFWLDMGEYKLVESNFGKGQVCKPPFIPREMYE